MTKKATGKADTPKRVSEETRKAIKAAVLDTEVDGLIGAFMAMEKAILEHIVITAQMMGAECSDDDESKAQVFFEAVVDCFVEACDEARRKP